MKVIYHKRTDRRCAILVIQFPWVRRHLKETYDIRYNAFFEADCSLLIGFGWKISKSTPGLNRLTYFPHLVWSWEVIHETARELSFEERYPNAQKI